MENISSNKQYLESRNLFLQNLIQGIAGIFLGVFFIVLCLLVLNYFQLITLSPLFPSLSFLPEKGKTLSFFKPTPSVDIVGDCSFYEAHPDFSSLQLPISGGIQGTITGTIQHISYEYSGVLARLRVLSAANNQVHDLFMLNQSGVIFGDHSGQNLLLKDLQVNDHVSFFYECTKMQDNQMSIQQIVVQGK